MNGNHIATIPDYSTSIAKAKAEFTKVRKVLQGRWGLWYGLIYPAKFQISYNGEEKEFLEASEAKGYMRKNTIMDL